MHNKIAIVLILMTPLIVQGQKKYKDGYYYNLTGEKVSCEIRLRRAWFTVFKSSNTYLQVKKIGEKKKQEIEGGKISSFVIEKDSFTVVRNIKINKINGEYERDFAQVLISGKLNLFLHHSGSSDGQSKYYWKRYVLNLSGTDKFIGIYDREKHRGFLQDLISSDSELVEKLNNLPEKKWIEFIPQLVNEFNSNANKR